MIKVGDFIKVKKDYETGGCDECHKDLIYWTKQPVMVMGTTEYGDYRVKASPNLIQDYWVIEKSDAIKVVLNLENK